ncbi:MAG: DUF362 domain-containing protein [Chloroflexia bacterium]|nr:DUF362 domain-containing protein [Chloroflexia bacterium]
MIAPNEFRRGRVAVIETRPESVLADVRQAMELAGYREALPSGNDTILEIGFSSPTWFPGEATTPWQLEGVVRALAADGYERLAALPWSAAGGDPRIGTANLKLGYVIAKYGLPSIHLDEPHIERARYVPTKPFLVLDRLFPEGVTIPKVFVGRNVVVLPTIKPHDVAAIAGAMAAARGGLLGDRRQRTLAAVDETLVDLLQIRQDLHAGLFTVMDGTLMTDGAELRQRNLLLASADQVAIDAVSASLQGLDPMNLPFIRIAHEKGLGIGEPREIEIVGYDRSLAEWQPITWDQVSEQLSRFRGKGWLPAVKKRLLASPATALTSSVTRIYRDAYWYPWFGRKQVRHGLETEWGRSFASYGNGRMVLPNPTPVPIALAAVGTAGLLGGIALGKKVGRSR